MKFFNQYKVLVAFLILLLTSCGDGFLDISPKGALTEDTFLDTDEDVKAALVGVYNTMQDNFSSGSWASVFFAKNLPGDDCLAGSSEGDQTGYQNIDDFKVETDNDKLKLIYQNSYRTINRTNTIINDVLVDTDIKRMIVAEAKALRAYTYLDLVVMFGGTPLMINNISSVTSENKHLPRATTEEVYAQIEKDLSEAIIDLPLKSEYSDADKYRLSKGAAQALLGKAYLYQKKYSDALEQFKYVISSSEYALEQDFANIWTVGHEFGIESLFEISFTSQESYDWGNFPWSGGNENNIDILLQGPRSDIFDFSNSSLNILNGWGFNLPSAKIGQAFEDENDVVRASATLMSEADFEATGGVIKNTEAHDYEGYMRIKYTTRPDETVTEGVGDLNYSTNWRVLRYADVLLMAAEAYHFSGDDANALIELNKVRTRAKLPSKTSSDDVFDAIVTERQLELAFEGSRFWDLVRWGLAEEELGSLGFRSGRDELFPIPQDEIISNNEIDESDQNPGY